LSESAGAGTASVRREIAAGAAWMLVYKFTERALGLFSTVILARILLPSDFGILAMALSLVAVIELLGSFSFDVALIQRHEVDRKHLDTAWTFNLIFGVVLFVLMAALAPAAAAYYRDERIEAVVYVLAAAWLIQNLENIGTVAFRRDLRFGREYWFLTVKKLLGVAVTVSLAFMLQSYWALVIGMVVSKSLSVFISYQMHPYRPKLSLAAARDLFDFSGWLLVNNVLWFFNQRITDFIVGRLAGAQALGLYNMSFEISNMPTTEIAAPVNRAMLPGYSKIARESGQLRQTYLDTVGAMALLTMPAGIGIAAIADPLVTVLLGANWIEAIPLMQILGIYGAIASIGTNTSSALLALGRPRMLTGLAAARIALLLPALVAATQAFGIGGAAWAVLIVTVVMTPVNFWVLLPKLGVRTAAFLGCLWRPALASAAMCYLVAETGGLLQYFDVHHPIAHLAAGVFVGAASYAIMILLLWVLAGRPGGAESIILRWALSLLRRTPPDRG
jgi:O-antigen/teichoic acid export membrane protein